MIELIIALIVFLVMAIIIFKFLKHVFLAIFLVIFLFILGLAGTGFLVYKDITDMSQNLLTLSNIVLLEDQEKLITGLQIAGLEEENITVFDDDKIESYQEDFASKNYDNILGDNYKIFIIKLDIFSGVGDVRVEKTTFTEEEIFEILRTDDVMETLYQVMLSKISLGIGLDTEEGKAAMIEALAKQFGSSSEIKSLFAAFLFIDKLQEEGSLFLIEQIKNGNIIIYPETITFRVMNLIPLTLFDKVAEKITA